MLVALVRAIHLLRQSNASLDGPERTRRATLMEEEQFELHENGDLPNISEKTTRTKKYVDGETIGESSVLTFLWPNQYPSQIGSKRRQIPKHMHSSFAPPVAYEGFYLEYLRLLSCGLSLSPPVWGLA